MSSENQPLRPINYVVLTEMPEQEEINVVNLDLCQWRYPKKVIDVYNDYQTSKGKKYKMPYRLTKWQDSNNILN